MATGGLGFRDDAERLASRFTGLAKHIKLKPACGRDLATLGAKAERSLAFVAAELPGAADQLQVPPWTLVRDLKGVIGGSCKPRALREGLTESALARLGDAELRSLAKGAKETNAVLVGGLPSMRPRGLDGIRESLEGCLRFFDELVTVAEKKGLSSWDVFEEVLQVRTYVGAIMAQPTAIPNTC